MKILGAADIHLGRRPGRLPPRLTDPNSARALGPAGAWERLIDLAIEEGVHALLLAERELRERCLLHVSCTRARDELAVTGYGGESPFLPTEA